MGKQNFYRVGQVARELQTSSYKIRRLAESGLIPDAEWNGAQWHIPVAAMERLKKEGVPPLPKVVDIDNEGAAPTANQKDRAPTTLLADPSPAAIAAAEEAEISGRQLATAKNRLEENKVRREEVEIEDFFADREKRLQAQEAEEIRRYEEEQEAAVRTRDKEAAAERRQKFFSEWLEYALRQQPYGAPDEVRLDIHAEVLTTLAKLDTNEREFVVRRLVDAAVERGLKTWKAGKAKRAAAEAAVEQAPYGMRWYEPWKSRAHKTALDALKDVGGSVTQEEMTSLARTVLQPIIHEFEHAGKVEEAVNAVRVGNANYEELREGQELVREALSALPNSARNRQITEAQEKALAPLSARVAERVAREEAQRQREQVLSSISWRLPSGITQDDRESALAEIREALDELPADASPRDMEEARNEVIQDYEEAYKEKARRAEKKAAQARNKAALVQRGLGQIRPYAERMLRQFDYDSGETAWDIDRRVRAEVQKTLEEELSGMETEQEVGRIVREVMRDIEGCH